MHGERDSSAEPAVSTGADVAAAGDSTTPLHGLSLHSSLSL